MYLFAFTKNFTEQKTQTFTQFNGLFLSENICWPIISDQEMEYFQPLDDTLFTPQLCLKSET